MVSISMLLILAIVIYGFSAQRFIPANSSNIWTVGRTRLNSDGSSSFDWESTQFYINIDNATFINMNMKASGRAVGRFVTMVDSWETSSVWVSGDVTDQTYKIASGLQRKKVQIRVISVLEPAFTRINIGTDSFFTFFGFSTDGIALLAGPARKRKIELVGDSISAGFGSRGFAPKTQGCGASAYTSGNLYTYNWQIAEHFNADLVPIAWSGKGMYQNCCDDGPKMPYYYLQTLGGDDFPQDWNFKRYTPDLMIINLGTNDFGHYNGPAWAARFESAFIKFIHSATQIYNNSSLPFFVAQGPMDCGSALNTSLQNVITATKRMGHNTMYLNMCGPPNDGCGGHPGVAGNAQMAQMAIPIIQKVMNWN